EGLTQPVDDMDLDTIGNFRETQHRIARPVGAGDAGLVEADGFVQRPARRLHDAALDLVADSVWVDRLPAVDRTDRTLEPRPSRFAIDLDLDREREIRALVLVPGEREAAPVTPGPRIARPAEARRRGSNNVARAGVVEVPQSELNRIESRRARELVDEAFDGEHVHVRAERAQRGDAHRHRRDEMMDHA